MIRRNHIDNGCKVDRQILRSRPRQSIEPSSASYHAQKLSPDRPLDENIRITTDNRKYYQYKEERESRSKNIREFRDEIKPEPLIEIQPNPDYRQDNALKREYTYDFEDTLKIDYNSISLKTQHQPEPKHMPTSNSTDIAEVTRPKQHQLNHNYIQNNHSYNPSLDRTQPSPFSPPKNRTAFPSSQKEPRLNSKTYTPLFEETNAALKKRELQQSSTRRESEGRIYEAQSKKIIKTDYEGRERRHSINQHPHSINKHPHSINKYISNQNYTPANNTHNYNTTASYNSTTKYQPTQIYSAAKGSPTLNSKDTTNLKVPSLPPSYHKEQVSQKLRMISDFNDQINERIKNIIGCFEGLKNKL